MRNLAIVGSVFLVLAVIVGYALFQMQGEMGVGPSVAPTAAMAQEAFDAGDFEACLQIVEMVLPEQPDSAELLMMAGESATKLERYEAALSYYQRVPTNSDRSGMALWASGELYFFLGKATPAVDAIMQSLEQDPNLLYAHERAINLLNTMGRRRETLPHLMFMMRANRMTIDYLLLMGNLAKEYAAPEELKRYKASSPEDRLPDLAEARILYSNGELKEAEQKLRGVIESMPELLEAHAQLGFVLLESTPEALTEWHESLPDTAASNPDLWFIRGQWMRGTDVPQAIRCQVEAIRLDPNHLKAHQALSQLLAQQGQKALASQFSAKAEKLQKINIGLEQIYKARQHPPTMREVAELTLELGRIWETLGWSIYAQSLDPNLSWPKELADEARKQNVAVEMPHTQPTANLVVNAKWVEQYPMPTFSRNSNAQTDAQSAAESSTSLQIAFRDVSATTGMEFQFDNNLSAGHDGHRIFETTGGGNGVIDYNLDGWPDLFWVQGGDYPSTKRDGDVLLCNRMAGDGRTFQSVTQQAWIDNSGFGQGVAIADVNSDGFDDIYVCNVGQNRLWINCGDGTFQSGDSIVDASEAWTSSAAIADLDGDGSPEIYDANYVEGEDVFSRMCQVGKKPRSCSPLVFSPSADRIVRSNEQGHFVTVDAGESMVANSLGVVIFRLDGSESPSIFVSADQQANLFGQVAIEGDSLVVEDEALISGLAYDVAGRAQACMGIAAGDCDGDGAIDLFVTNFYDEYYTLFLQSSGLFEDKTARSGTIAATKPLLGFGAQFLDVQLDGVQDLFVLNGHIDDHTHIGVQQEMPTQLFLGDGGGRFQLVAPSEAGGFFSQQRLGRSLSKLDYDRDGMVDLAVGDLEQPSALVRNESKAMGQSLMLRLVGVESDRNGFLAEAEVESSQHASRQQLVAGGGYQSSNQRVLHFAIPSDDSECKLTIRWPSGQTDVYEGLAPNEEYCAIEGQGISLESR